MSKIGTDKVYVHGEHSVFVFGSNLAGIHGSGAALAARRLYGARNGIGEGFQGASYALPTMDNEMRTLELHEIRKHVGTFIRYAKLFPELTFFVTRVGCGLAGLTDEQIGPMFAGAPDNCDLPHGWGKAVSR